MLDAYNMSARSYIRVQACSKITSLKHHDSARNVIRYNA